MEPEHRAPQSAGCWWQVATGTETDAVVATWNTFNASTAPIWFTLSAAS